MKKINLKLRLNNRIQLKNILEYFENVAFYKRKNYWDIDIFFFSKIEEIIAKKYLRNTKYLNFKTIEEKNWIKANIQEDKVNSTELFSFSQGLKKQTKKKKTSSLPSCFRSIWNWVTRFNSLSCSKY